MMLHFETVTLKYELLYCSKLQWPLSMEMYHRLGIKNQSVGFLGNVSESI